MIPGIWAHRPQTMRRGGDGLGRDSPGVQKEVHKSPSAKCKCKKGCNFIFSVLRILNHEWSVSFNLLSVTP